MPISKQAVTDTVNLWFEEKIKAGAIARDTVALNQAFEARADLIERFNKLLPDTDPTAGEPAA